MAWGNIARDIRRGFRFPEALLCTLSKILEKILNKRLIWFLEANEIISNSQYGCRKGRSTSMALIELDALIHTVNSNNSTLYSISLDLENAFPRIWQHLILSLIHISEPTRPY